MNGQKRGGGVSVELSFKIVWQQTWLLLPDVGEAAGWRKASPGPWPPGTQTPAAPAAAAALGGLCGRGWCACSSVVKKQSTAQRSSAPGWHAGHDSCLLCRQAA